MRATFASLCFGFAMFACVAMTGLAQDHQHGMDGGTLGTVHMATSCSADAQPIFDAALAALHSFEFARAIEGFDAAFAKDSSCAMAWWGIALARWGNPFTAAVRPIAQLKPGQDAIARARLAGAKTPRERAYIEADATLFDHADTIDQRSRVVAYEHAMGRLAADHPEDREAAIFHALSLAASAQPTDKTYANQLAAGAILEKIFVEEPEHPGVAHYIIHSYDVPALADRALDAARRYAAIAPSAPHALHMPSHAFTRVGAWKESIETNLLSEAAAKRDHSTAEELHAMDYLAYAYLQTGQDRAVEQMVASLPDVNSRFDVNAIGSAAPGSAGLFALAAIPARWALERRDWKAAASLQAHDSDFPFTEAMTYFAMALGAAHTGDLDRARFAIGTLQRISERLSAGKDAYWAEQVAIQHLAASSVLAQAGGKTTDALALIHEAVNREDATEKNVVTPGPLAPARELLADLLMELKQPAQALVEYRAALQKEPNRFRSVYGAARAAALAGDVTTSRQYFTQLLKICESADAPSRPELVEARAAIRAAAPAARRSR